MSDLSAAPPTSPVEAPRAAAYWARIRGLLVAPSEEWRTIAGERPALERLFLLWVAPLVLVFYLAPQVGSIAFAPRINGVAVPPSVVRALYTIVMGGALTCAGVWAIGHVLNYLAPHFDGRRDLRRAMQLSAYSGAALWLSGLFGLVPPLAFLSVAGIASLFTLYRGVPAMMEAPPEKALSYSAAAVACGAVLGVVLMSLSSCLAIIGGGSALSERRPAPVVSQPVAAPAAVDPKAPVDADKMRRLLPEALPGGWVRGGVDINAGGALGFTGRTVAAAYENGERRLTLSVIDLGPGRDRAAIEALKALRPARADSGGEVRHADGAGGYVFEETDVAAARCRRLSVTGGRIVLYAEGEKGVALEDLRTAVAFIDPLRLDQLARGL